MGKKENEQTALGAFAATVWGQMMLLTIIAVLSVSIFITCDSSSFGRTKLPPNVIAASF